MTPAVEETNIAPPLLKGFTGMVRNLARSAMLSKKAERQARQRAGVLAVRRCSPGSQVLSSFTNPKP
jgi:hypothetical protein